MNNKKNLIGVSIIECQEIINNLNEKKFRVKQIMDWIYKKKKFKIEEMTNLPSNFRNLLKKNTIILLPEIVCKEISKIDGTTKYLFELEDKERIETAYMPHLVDGKIKRNTICVSTQVGCPVGCSFCATGREGFTRNLTTSEIIGQILSVEKDKKIDITNIVFMGMGEPLLNYENVINAIKIIIHKDCLNISARKITLSTSGFVPQIKLLADENIPLVLAISLHNPWNEKRNVLIPINKKYNIEDLLKACEYYIVKTNRKITFEYALIKDVNSSKKDAKKLAELLKGMLCNVNLIPVNEVEGTNNVRPNKEQINIFRKILEKEGIECTIREEKGADISAACGQLKGKK